MMVQQQNTGNHNYGNNPNKKFNIVLCELHNKYIHGFTDESDPYICGHYLVICTSTNYSICRDEDVHNNASVDDASEEDNEDEHIDRIARFHRNEYIRLLYDDYPNRFFGPNKEHDLIRNYDNIVRNVHRHIKPEIALKVYLSGGECVAILKTFWICIIQRAWKRVYLQRMEVHSRRMCIDSLEHRSITGRWPGNCFHIPSLYGLLVSR
jgi:hypothetical protein